MRVSTCFAAQMQQTKKAGMMEIVEEEGISVGDVFVQKLQYIKDQFDNPDADEVALEMIIKGLNKSLNKLWEAGGQENLKKSATAPLQLNIILNSDGTREIQLFKVDESVKSTEPRKEKAQENEEDAKIDRTSAHGEDAYRAMQVEEVDDDSDAPHLPSQRQFPSVWESIVVEEMPAMSKEKADVAAQVVKEENTGKQSAERDVKESVSHRCNSKDALLGILSCTCGEMCVNIRSLSGHIYQFDNGRIFRCDFCERYFAYLLPLVNHLKVSHQNRRFDEVELQATIKVEGQRRSRRIRNEPERYSQIQVYYK